MPQLLDKRVNTELSRIRNDVDQKLNSVKDTIRADIADDISELKSRVDSITDVQGQTNCDISKNIVIRGLRNERNENVVTWVNTYITEGLKIRDVKCDKAERKQSSVQPKPSVIVAQMASTDVKRKVMATKNWLKRKSSIWWCMHWPWPILYWQAHDK